MMQPNHNNERHMAKEKSSIGSSWMDVKGAFPSVNIEWLVHNMQIRGIPSSLPNGSLSKLV